MPKDWVDFKKVKETVTMEMVLAHYGLEIRRVNATYLRGKCPLPTHTSSGGKPSFGVHTQKNAWACQSASCVSAREEKKGGNVLDFVAVMEGCSIRDSALKLQNWFSVSASNERPADYVPSRDRKNESKKLVREKKDEQESDKTSVDVSSVETEVPNKPLEFALKSIDSTHPYLKARGIKQETAECFGAGYFYGKGSMSNRVVIPIHNEVGELIAYAGRAVDDETEPKYKLPNGFKKSLVLFNLYQAIETGEKRIIVVEGYFDSMKVLQAGFPCVVSLMGSTLSEEQEKLLVQNFDSVILLLDGDEVGRSAISEVASRLVREVFVRVVDVPEGKQPDQLSSEELQNLLKRFEGGA